MVVMRGPWRRARAVRIVPCTCARRQLAMELDA